MNHKTKEMIVFVTKLLSWTLIGSKSIAQDYYRFFTIYRLSKFVQFSLYIACDSNVRLG